MKRIEILGVQPMSSPHNKRYWPYQTMSSPHNKRYWPYQTMVQWNEIKQIERWCYSCMKSGNWRSQGQFFAFKQEADFLAFTLRWA